MPPILPRCAKHPTMGVISARRVGTDRRVWCCIACGAVLGAAPGVGDAAFETDAIEISPDDIETLDEAVPIGTADTELGE